MVGEGGNLGFTQLGRVEYALGGGLIYTDAIDNSAGVDCSDHEVNIKILLGDVIVAGEMTLKQRNQPARRDDRRGRRARARQQPGADAGADDRPPPGAADGQRPRPLPRRSSSAKAGSTAALEFLPIGQADRRAPVDRLRPHHARVRGADRLHEERQRRRDPHRPTCPTDPALVEDLSSTSRCRCGSGSARRSCATGCAARSPPPSSSTRWSTSRGSRTTIA